MSENLSYVREEYINLIKKELLGPGSEVSIPDEEHELISSPPQERYCIGVLYPQNTEIIAGSNDSMEIAGGDDSGEDDYQLYEGNTVSEGASAAKKQLELSGDVDSTEENNMDEEIGMSTQNKPSSMGVSFIAKGNTRSILCNISFAVYRKAKHPDCAIPFAGSEEDNYEIPIAAAGYLEYDKQSKCLKMRIPFNRKDVRALYEKDVLGENGKSVVDAMYKLATQFSKGYVRVPYVLPVELDFEEVDYVEKSGLANNVPIKITALKRSIPGKENMYSVTIMLVNESIKGDSSKFHYITQPRISISTETNDFVFFNYSGADTLENLDDEEKSLELQYRNKSIYATGLGTSANWTVSSEGKGEIFTDFFPKVEVPSMDFGIDEKYGMLPGTLGMKYLSDLNDDDRGSKIEHMRSLVESYGKWIEELREKQADIDPKFAEISEKNINGCVHALNRMRNGIKLLKEDETCWNAFQLANRAMYMQRIHILLQNMTSDKERYDGDSEIEELLEKVRDDYKNADKVIKDKNGYTWRPFQLAFLLMSIESIARDESPDRELVDLIWFPTGGGKTEAYLGLTAFSIFFRRLNHLQESDGTAVIMRYTLRLLASQQFTRASTLICACEWIRRDCSAKRSKYKKYPLGGKPITIGLWVGSDHIPNTNKKAGEELKRLNDADSEWTLKNALDQHNKFQVLKCPWCGTKMTKGYNEKKLVGKYFGYRMRSGHFSMFCTQQECDFYSALPIQVVDQELYLNPPTLLFGTVDKFAMMPKKKEIASFFGLGTGNRAPELIIQDELHLISGPLGTMVGMYETAIESLCEEKGVKTKIIASTATIRRAKEQCSALYNREVAQFPHPGLDSEDSFFAREKEIDHDSGKFGRMYVGLMPSGKTKAMMEARSIAALMQTIKSMDLSYETKDKYWTLTSYFNSLKDLGKCKTLVEDDVKNIIKTTVYRLGTDKDARMIAAVDELTSRVTTTELNETLDKLEKWQYAEDNKDTKRYPSSIVIATNMISVGIDVARLNVMLIVGQPKLTSEYIQASSRIGRSYPGVAFTMYDGSKSRDRSHYEQFKAYHESFYKFVEPTGVTPFSKPARDRALHAVVITLLRLLEPELTADAAAQKFNREKYRDRIEKVKTLIAKRSNDITKRLNPDIEDETDAVLREIDYVLETWEVRANNYEDGKFSYGDDYAFKEPADGFGRLMKDFDTTNSDGAFETMTSMRNVDSAVRGNVLIWED